MWIKIISGALMFLCFSAGLALRPVLDWMLDAYELESSSYVATSTATFAETEYEKKVNELWKSKEWQETCRAQAAFNVSYDLMNFYKDMASQEIDRSQFPQPATMPMMDAIERASGR